MNSAFRSSGDLIADRRFDYAMAAKEEGDLSAAADLIRQTLDIVPGWATGWFSLGEVEAAAGNAVEAEAAFRAALERDPADALGAGLALARLGKADAASAMSAAYVTALFDQYAPRFDKALREGLAYRGPELIADAIARVAAARGLALPFARVLDLGCGTGLFGEVFAGQSHWLGGVDLSPAMVEAAARKGLYQHLAVGDLTAALDDQVPGSLSLAVAADVFVYVADLAPILAAAHRALAPGGLLAFSVQTHEGDDVRLGADLRYAHAEPLVRRLLTGAEFRVELCERASTRRERDVPVPGLIVVASKG